jgi:hypothetical protein
VNANRIFALVTVLVIAAVFGLGWFLGVAPLLAQAALADAERSTVEQNNLAETAKLEQMRAVHERLGELETELADLRISIPAEVDSDFIYTLFADIQANSGAVVKTIATSEAVPYGTVTAGGEAAVPAPVPAPTDGSTPTATPSAPAEFYTVPLTFTFDTQPVAAVYAFAEGLQTSPRLFLVTSVVADSTTSSTVTAYMFVMRDDDAPRAAAYLSLNGLLTAKTAGKVAVAPTPESSPTPEESGEPTPTPTPTP